MWTLPIVAIHCGGGAPFHEMTTDKWRRVTTVNLDAVFWTFREAAKHMIARGEGGKIINMASQAGRRGEGLVAVYCASKAAVHALSDALRMELKPFGVDVITVQPGGIRSAFGERAAAQVRAVLPEHSRYAAVADSIIARAQDSQGGAMEADEFARRMLDQVLATKAPHTVRIGKGSFTLPFFKRYAPVRLRDQHLMKRYALEQLGLRP